MVRPKAAIHMLLRLFCVVIAVFIAERIGLNTHLGFGEVSAIGLPSGVAVGLLVLWGRRVGVFRPCAGEYTVAGRGMMCRLAKIAIAPG